MMALKVSPLAAFHTIDTLSRARVSRADKQLTTPLPEHPSELCFTASASPSWCMPSLSNLQRCRVHKLVPHCGYASATPTRHPAPPGRVRPPRAVSTGNGGQCARRRWATLQVMWWGMMLHLLFVQDGVDPLSLCGVLPLEHVERERIRGEHGNIVHHRVRFDAELAGPSFQMSRTYPLVSQAARRYTSQMESPHLCHHHPEHVPRVRGGDGHALILEPREWNRRGLGPASRRSTVP